MRAGELNASAAPKNTDSTTIASMVIRSVNISAANSVAISPDRIWLSFTMRINPTLSAMAPDRMTNSIIGTRSAKATMPSQLVDSVSSQASQPTAVRFIQRPVAASVWPIIKVRYSGCCRARPTPPKRDEIVKDRNPPSGNAAL